jgi:hypothetical protein
MFTKIELIERLINCSTQESWVVERMTKWMLTWSNDKLIYYCEKLGHPVEKFHDQFIFKF